MFVTILYIVGIYFVVRNVMGVQKSGPVDISVDPRSKYQSSSSPHNQGNSNESDQQGKHIDTQFTREVIEKEFPFVQQWSTRRKEIFVWRTHVIMSKKHFHGAEGFEVTPRHQVVISATLARLTFGLSRNFDLPKFELIEVYPREFYSKLLEQQVKGLTLGHGRLFLSWAHFEEGHEDPDDKVHVGLHEFAHAMMIEFDRFTFLPAWDKWQEVAHPIMRSITYTRTHFFRQYGATNIHEFWAVAVETFFEQPDEFKTKYPALFHETCRMLNQWPE